MGSFKEKVNNEVIATLGNFLYRVLLFAWKNFGEVRMEVSMKRFCRKSGRLSRKFSQP